MTVWCWISHDFTYFYSIQCALPSVASFFTAEMHAMDLIGPWYTFKSAPLGSLNDILRLEKCHSRGCLLRSHTMVVQNFSLLCIRLFLIACQLNSAWFLTIRVSKVTRRLIQLLKLLALCLYMLLFFLLRTGLWQWDPLLLRIGRCFGQHTPCPASWDMLNQLQCSIGLAPQSFRHNKVLLIRLQVGHTRHTHEHVPHVLTHTHTVWQINNIALCYIPSTFQI